MAFLPQVAKARNAEVSYTSAVGPLTHQIPKSYIDAGLLAQHDYGVTNQLLPESAYGEPVHRDVQDLYKHDGQKAAGLSYGDYAYIPEWQQMKELAPAFIHVRAVRARDLGSFVYSMPGDNSSRLPGNCAKGARTAPSVYNRLTDPENPIATIQPAYMQRLSNTGGVVAGDAAESGTTLPWYVWLALLGGGGAFVYFKFFHKGMTDTARSVAPAARDLPAYVAPVGPPVQLPPNIAPNTGLVLPQV